MPRLVQRPTNEPPILQVFVWLASAVVVGGEGLLVVGATYDEFLDCSNQTFMSWRTRGRLDRCRRSIRATGRSRDLARGWSEGATHGADGSGRRVVPVKMSVDAPGDSRFHRVGGRLCFDDLVTRFYGRVAEDELLLPCTPRT